jgi:hypothetical protein
VRGLSSWSNGIPDNHGDCRGSGGRRRRAGTGAAITHYDLVAEFPPFTASGMDVHRMVSTSGDDIRSRYFSGAFGAP